MTPDPPETPTPRERRRAQRLESRRREIVTVAESLFAAHGYDGTSLEKIAGGSGYSVGGIYNFFPSKDAVYEAVLDRHGSALAERLMAAADSAETGMGTLLAMATTAIHTLREFPGQARLTVRSLTPDDPARKGTFRKILEAYAIAIREGQRDGTIRAGEARHLAQYVGGLVLAQTNVDPEISGNTDGIPLDDFLTVLKAALSA